LCIFRLLLAMLEARFRVEGTRGAMLRALRLSRYLGMPRRRSELISCYSQWKNYPGLREVDVLIRSRRTGGRANDCPKRLPCACSMVEHGPAFIFSCQFELLRV